jgi:aryl-alcohol dehydrogenase-like predicted oxidoreductase
MKYGNVPYLDTPISKIVLGVIPLSPKDLGRSFAVLDAYRAAGGNILDNSYSYGPGFAEVVKAYLEARGRESLVLFDKGNHHSGHAETLVRRVTKEDIDHDIRGNLERTGAGYSDFYVLHRDDPAIPIGNVVEWLNEHVEAGRIKVFGGSNFHHSRIAEGNAYAAEKGIQGFSVSSPNLSLALANEPMWFEAYQVDQAGRDWYVETGFPLFSWSSGGGGFFANVESDDVKRVYHNPTNFARKERVDQLAAELGVTSTQLSLAWTLNHPGNIWGIIGPYNVEQLEDNIQAASIELTPEQHRWLEHG